MWILYKRLIIVYCLFLRTVCNTTITAIYYYSLMTASIIVTRTHDINKKSNLIGNICDPETHHAHYNTTCRPWTLVNRMVIVLRLCSVWFQQITESGTCAEIYIFNQSTLRLLIKSNKSLELFSDLAIYLTVFHIIGRIKMTESLPVTLATLGSGESDVDSAEL